MANSVKEVFDEECSHLVIDPKFVKKISDYRTAFEMKDPDHATFFGGNLTGVQKVRFLQSDRDAWFEEILEINDIILQDKLHSLPSVDPERNVASDVMNLSCVWLMHAIYNSKKLNDAQKKQGMIDVAMVMQFKFLTSRLYRLFRYPADPETAAAAYAQLSMKYAIKQLGNWRAVLEARAQEITSKTGIHHRAISQMDNDNGVFYLLTDSQGRIRDMLKNIYDVFLKTHQSGARISVTSNIAEYDGKEILKDVTKSTLAYTRYIHSIITDKNSFVKPELLSIIENLMHSTPPKLILESLNWMSANYNQASAGIIQEVIDEAMVHAFDYLAQNRSIASANPDIGLLLSRLKGVYMSSRSTDPALIQLRQKAEQIAKFATGNRHPSVIASVRTSLLLYVILRAFTMRYYSTNAISGR